MSVIKIRNLLGIFFLGITALLGAYIILFAETAALPVSKKDATSAFQIIIPTLVAQLTIAFKWIASPPAKPDTTIQMPMWAVVGPPVAVTAILLLTVARLVP